MALSSDTKIWSTDDFSGGLSESSKRGIQGAFRGGIGIDVRTEPDLLTANRRLKLDSSATVDGLVLWMVEAGTDTYMLADNGDLYKRNSAGTYSLINNFSGCAGQGLALFDDYIYVAGASALHRYGPLSGTPTVQTDFLTSPANEIDQWSGNIGGANVYTLQTAINEGATHRKSFTPTVSTITGIVLNIVSKGTGDVTVTVHDNSNVLVAAVTISNASLPSAGRVRFNFTGSHTITAAGSYHFHATTSVGTTTIRATTSADCTTAEYATLKYFTDEDVDQENDLTETIDLTTTYTPPVSISEALTARQTFTPQKSNLLAVGLLVNANGTGDWTVTVHDSLDAVVATKTIANASVTEAKGWVKFQFTTAVKILPDAEYHFHVTSTVADGSLFSDTASDLEGAAFQTYYQVLQTDSDWHPMVFYPGAQALVIGNGNFLAVYDGIIYKESGIGTGSERLQFATEEKVRCLALVGDHLSMGVWKGDSIGDHGSSRLYFWDGSSSEATSLKDITGEVNAILTGDDGLLNVWHGGEGKLSVYDGAITLVKTIPLIGENKTVEIYPGAVTNWSNIPRFGISDGSSTTVVRAVYGYGAKSKDFPRALTIDYPISTGTTGSGVQVGAMLGIGPTKFLVSWKDSSSYGVDIIDTANDQASVTYETLVFDDGTPYFEKRGRDIKVTCDTLASDQTITVKYKINREASWQSLGTLSFASDGAINAKSFSFVKRFRDLEIQLTLATSGATAPTVYSLSLFFYSVDDEAEKK